MRQECKQHVSDLPLLMRWVSIERGFCTDLINVHVYSLQDCTEIWIHYTSYKLR
jgi:hypothetical protein